MKISLLIFIGFWGSQHFPPVFTQNDSCNSGNIRENTIFHED